MVSPDHFAPRCPVCDEELTEHNCECDGIRCSKGHVVFRGCYGGSVEICSRCPIDKRVQNLDVAIGRLHAMDTE